MVGFNKRQILDAMNQIDQENYRVFFEKLAKKYDSNEFNLDTKTPVSLEIVEDYVQNILFPKIAELIERNNEEITQNLERAIKDIARNKERTSYK